MEKYFPEVDHQYDKWHIVKVLNMPIDKGQTFCVIKMCQVYFVSIFFNTYDYCYSLNSFSKLCLT